MNKKISSLADIQALHRDGRLEEARAGYLALLKEDPHNASVLHFLGLLYADEGNLDQAQACLEEAQALAPSNLVLYLHLAIVLKAKNLLDEAAVLLRGVLHLDPQFVAAWNNLGAVYFAQGRWQEAVDAYQSAIDIQPDYIDAYYNLGLALSKARQIVSAINTYEALIKLDPHHSGGRFQLACLLMEQNHYEAAIAHFDMIAVNHPFHFETQSNLATCYLKLGWLSKASEYYRLALEMVPDDLQILFNLGVIFMQQGRTYDAVNYYERALRIDPDFYEAHNNLAVANLALGKKEEALVHFQTMGHLQPDNHAVQHLIHILMKKEGLSFSPAAYVRSLFDSYAGHYDAHLKHTLHYQLPHWMYQVIAEKAPIKAPSSLSILDLGCGTGLCGERFKHFARRLIGVDISEKMLKEAEAKQVYDQLIQEDIVAFLKKQQNAFDLILAGDVLVYFGDLSAVFRAVYQALMQNGLFIFNLEIGKAAYAMTDSGRFAHDKQYVDELIAGLHFVTVDYRIVPVRTEEQEVVMGHLYLLKRVTVDLSAG